MAATFEAWKACCRATRRLQGTPQARSQARVTSLWSGATLLLELAWSDGILPRWADQTSLLGPDFLRCSRQGLGLGLLDNLKKVTKGGAAGVVTATGPLGAGGWGSALGLVLRGLGGFSARGFLVLPSFLVPGGSLLLPRGRAAVAALQRTLVPRFREPLLDHVQKRDVDRGA